jgi:2'-5' RNA ligase
MQSFALPIDEWRRRSNVAVVVPELDSVLGDVRARFTADGRFSPSHVTLLHPFYAPPEVDDSIRGRIVRALEGAAPFWMRLDRVGRFPQGVFYLAPQDPGPFVRLAERLMSEFPEMPRYGGEFATVVPHVSFFDTTFASDAKRDEAAVLAVAEAALPFAIEVTDVVLIQRIRPSPASWDVTARFTLAES